MQRVLSVTNIKGLPVKKLGFSLIEAILAIAVLGIIVTIIASFLLLGQEAAVLSGSRNRATLLAEESLEAIRNIRDDNFSNLIDGSYGLSTSSNQWNLVAGSDMVDIYNRQIIINTINSYTKQATVNVTWQQNLQRSGLVSLIGYFTDWQRTAATLGGILIYGNNSTSTAYRTYDTVANNFSSEALIPTNANGQTFIIRTSPTKNEALAGFVTSAGVLNVLCYDGSSWHQEWTVIVGGNGSTRRFDLAYETASGDALILYSTNSSVNNELAYRTKSGSASCGSGGWTVASNFNPIRTSGAVYWVKMAWDRRNGQNLIAALWADSNRDLSAAIWNGAAWVNEPATASETNLEIASVAQDLEDFDIEYESLSGDIMLIWGTTVGSGANGVRYRLCTGGTSTCAWGAVATPPTFADNATNLDISANPNTDQIVFASIGDLQNDLQLGYWSGTAWSNTANIDTSCNTPTAGTRLVATGWLIAGANTRSIIRYADQGSSAIDWYTGNNNVFTKQTDFTVSPAVSNPKFFDIQMNPLSEDQLLLVTSGDAASLLAKRLVINSSGIFAWTNSDGSLLESSLSQIINSPFSFAFWRN